MLQSNSWGSNGDRCSRYNLDGRVSTLWLFWSPNVSGDLSNEARKFKELAKWKWNIYYSSLKHNGSPEPSASTWAGPWRTAAGQPQQRHLCCPEAPALPRQLDPHSGCKTAPATTHWETKSELNTNMGVSNFWSRASALHRENYLRNWP